MAASMAITASKYIAGTALTGSVLVLGGLWWFQRHLIYPANFPQESRTSVPKPSQLGMPYEDVYLTTSDKVKLHAYVIPARRQVSAPSAAELQRLSEKERKERFEKDVESWAEEMGKEEAVEYVRGRPTVVIFHANAGNMGHRIPLARKFSIEFKCNVFMLSYRGYGKSEGFASEMGIRKDITAALEYIQAHPLLGGTKLIVYGQSIGGAVSMYAAANHPDLISGIILENTFISLTRLIPSAMPWIPSILLPVLLTERWDTEKLMPLIPTRTPMLMLSGLKDELVLPSHMAHLRDMRRGQVSRNGTGLDGLTEANDEKSTAGEPAREAETTTPKLRWAEFPLGGHNDTCMIPDYWKEIGEWLKDEFLLAF